MERTGLVARIEHELERVLSWGKLPRNGILPSEQVLAKRHGVSRATAREALLRLEARGLLVQHPGRRSRAVPLQDAVTLENLSVALHAEGPAHPERRRLLEGFFELKRALTVELLADCCEHASESDMNRLLDVCFLLSEAAHWEESSVWAKREFELLRLAALAANRPGHFLLVQTLERSYWAMAGRVLPLLDRAAISRWGLCAFHALGDRDVQRLKQDLPALIQSSDEHVFSSHAPSHEEYIPPLALHRQANQHLERSLEPSTGSTELSATAHPNPSACQTRSCEEPAEAEAQTESPQGGLLDAAMAHPSACQTRVLEEQPERTPLHTPTVRPPPDAVEAHRSACWTSPRREPSESATSGPPPELQWPDTAVEHRSTCQTGSCQALVEDWTAQIASTWSPMPWARCFRRPAGAASPRA